VSCDLRVAMPDGAVLGGLPGPRQERRVRRTPDRVPLPEGAPAAGAGGGGAFPRFARNHGTGEPVAGAVRTRRTSFESFMVRNIRRH
jgi:hypothetical protein